MLSFKTTTQAVRYTKLHHKIIKKKGTEVRHFISRENPLGLVLLAYKPLEYVNEVVETEMVKPKTKLSFSQLQALEMAEGSGSIQNNISSELLKKCTLKLMTHLVKINI